MRLLGIPRNSSREDCEISSPGGLASSRLPTIADSAPGRLCLFPTRRSVPGTRDGGDYNKMVIDPRCVSGTATSQSRGHGSSSGIYCASYDRCGIAYPGSCRVGDLELGNWEPWSLMGKV